MDIKVPNTGIILIWPYQYDASIWYFDIHTTAMKVFTSAFLVVMVSHALQGLKAIEDDYFTERTIGMFMPGMTYLAKYVIPGINIPIVLSVK